jgi:uncharacterized protein (DUF433 family)
MKATLPKPVIHDRGRGPEIKGTRITVYDILEYHLDGHHHTWIAAFLRLSSDQVLAAIDYIEAHKAQVMTEYRKMLAREKKGNPPHVRAILRDSHKKFLAFQRRIDAERKLARGKNARTTNRR